MFCVHDRYGTYVDSKDCTRMLHIPKIEQNVRMNETSIAIVARYHLSANIRDPTRRSVMRRRMSTRTRVRCKDDMMIVTVQEDTEQMVDTK